ncbi:MAG: PEP/pyruvate-binding domain-containing protein [Colwellia sp.]
MHIKIIGQNTLCCPNSLGGKGASLLRLSEAGYLVPHGFIIPATLFEQSTSYNDIRVEILRILNSVRLGRYNDFEIVSLYIKNLILNIQFSDDIKFSIIDEFNKSDFQRVAVRSSALLEDGIKHSWAGQLDSFLNVNKEKLIDSIKKCWASMFNSRAILYSLENNLLENTGSVAVIIQRMLECEISGVAFSKHPNNDGGKEVIIIEAAVGSCINVVDGSIKPITFIVDKNDINSVLLRTNPNQKVLTSDLLFNICKLVLSIEQFISCPVDIEWGIFDNQIFILQARPIT